MDILGAITVPTMNEEASLRNSDSGSERGVRPTDIHIAQAPGDSALGTLRSPL